MDARETLRQIGVGNLMAVGALPWRSLSQGDDKIQFTVGSNRGLLEKIVVTITPLDVYTVEYVVMCKRTCAVLLRETETDVYDTALGTTVRRMGDREWTAAKLQAAQAQRNEEQTSA